MERNLYSALFLLAFFVSGCATTYTGPAPNFKLIGKDAEAEAEKFKFEESFWKNSTGIIVMGPEKTSYKENSLRPLVDQVSPVASEKLDSSRRLNAGVLWSAVVAVAAIIAGHNAKDANASNNFDNLVWLAIGSEVGFGIASSWVHSNAAAQFNKDLRSKFTPIIGINTSF
jgi:hypothetical protein